MTPSLRSTDARLEERSVLLSDAARALPGLATTERERLREQVLEFLRGDVAEHLEADSRLLYPVVAERLADPLAPAPLTYEDRAIRWWTSEIAAADLADTDELQRLLYGLHALLRVHLSREEDLYVGALETPGWPAQGT